MTLIRTPMISQADRVVLHADVSCNTELDVISVLSSAAGAAGRTHGILLMVELGDLREGIMPDDLEGVVRQTLRFPNISLKGIGTNLACRSGVSPDARNMMELSALADSIDATFGVALDIVSGGNSSSLEWALSGANTGRIGATSTSRSSPSAVKISITTACNRRRAWISSGPAATTSLSTRAVTLCQSARSYGFRSTTALCCGP